MSGEGGVGLGTFRASMSINTLGGCRAETSEPWLLVGALCGLLGPSRASPSRIVTGRRPPRRPLELGRRRSVTPEPPPCSRGGESWRLGYASGPNADIDQHHAEPKLVERPLRSCPETISLGLSRHDERSPPPSPVRPALRARARSLRLRRGREQSLRQRRVEQRRGRAGREQRRERLGDLRRRGVLVERGDVEQREHGDEHGDFVEQQRIEQQRVEQRYGRLRDERRPVRRVCRLL